MQINQKRNVAEISYFIFIYQVLKESKKETHN